MADIQDAHFETADGTVIGAMIDGMIVSGIFMTEEGYRQRQMQAWIDAGGVPAPYDPATALIVEQP